MLRITDANSPKTVICFTINATSSDFLDDFATAHAWESRSNIFTTTDLRVVSL